jgi:hypothetical protein
MLSLVDLYWINLRLQQALKNNLLYGGIPIAFIGNPGQLPDFCNLCRGPGVTLERLVKISEGIKLKVRLKEDERLDTLVTQTQERFDLT